MICLPVCVAINFEINLFYRAVFLHEQKISKKISFLKGFSAARNCLRPTSWPLNVFSLGSSQSFVPLQLLLQE